MAVSRDFIQQLTAAADIVQIVGECVSLKKRGNNMVGLCPFHAEKTPSFSVNVSKGFYYCFGCGANGDALSFVIKTEGNDDFMNGVELLAQRLGMSVPRDGKAGDDKAAAVVAAAAVYFRRQLQQTPIAKQYLQKRGLHEDTVARFGIGYAAADWHGLANALRGEYDESLMLKTGLLRKNDKGDVYDYFRGRLMFPIMESARRTIAFGGRALGDEEPKYLNSPESFLFAKKRTVFGLPQAAAAAREKNRIIITEGYMDTVMLSQAGFAETAAAMGTALTPQQMQKIARAADNVILAFDGDVAGQKAAARSLSSILPVLRDGMSVRFLFLPAGADPDSFVREQGADVFEKAIAAALPLGDYLVRLLWSGDGVADNAAAVSAASEEGKTSAALAAGEKLIRLVDSERAPFMRELLVRRLATHAKISPEAMRRTAARNTAIATGAARGGNRGRYRMRGEGLLYRLLCCMADSPVLIEELQDNPPLPGNQTESGIVAAVLHHLRGDGGGDVIAYLNQEGFVALARQIKETLKYYREDVNDKRAEFFDVLQMLRVKHEEITNIDRQKRFDKIYGKEPTTPIVGRKRPLPHNCGK